MRYCKKLLEKGEAAANISEAVHILEKSLSQVRLISYNLSSADTDTSFLDENEEKGLYIFISDDGCGFDYDAERYGNSGFTRLGASKHFL